MRMQLLTKEIERKLEKAPMRSTEGVAPKDRKVIVKFFAPWNSWTWYVVEAERRDDEYEWEFYTLCVNGYGETSWGSTTLGQLREINGPAGLKIERDRHYTHGEWLRDLERLGVS